MQYYAELLETKTLPLSKQGRRQRQGGSGVDIDADVIVTQGASMQRAPKKRKTKATEAEQSARHVARDVEDVEDVHEGLEAWEMLESMLDDLEPMGVGMAVAEPIEDSEPHRNTDTPVAVAVAEPIEDSEPHRDTDIPVAVAVPEPMIEDARPQMNADMGAMAAAMPPPLLHAVVAESSPEDIALQRRHCDMMIDSGYYGIFRFTRTQRGFSARCPWHRRNKKTDCKKAISVSTPMGAPIPREDIVLCWRRLATWCLAHGQYQFQREHVAYTPSADQAQVLGFIFNNSLGQSQCLRHSKKSSQILCALWSNCWGWGGS